MPEVPYWWGPASAAWIKNYQSGDCVLNLTEIPGTEDFDYDDQNTDFFSVGKKVKIDLADMDYVSWMRELEII